MKLIKYALGFIIYSFVFTPLYSFGSNCIVNTKEVSTAIAVHSNSIIHYSAGSIQTRKKGKEIILIKNALVQIETRHGTMSITGDKIIIKTTPPTKP